MNNVTKNNQIILCLFFKCNELIVSHCRAHPFLSLWSYITSSYTFCCTDCKKFKYFNFGHFLTVSFDLILLSCTHPLNNIWFGIYHLPESMWVQHKKLNREWGLDLTNSQFSSTSTSPFIFSFSLMCFSLYIKTLNFSRCHTPQLYFYGSIGDVWRR